MTILRENETSSERSQRLENLRKYKRSRKLWKTNLIRNTSQNYICTSECRYKARGAVTPVLFDKENTTFTNAQLVYLTLNNQTISLDGHWYVCFSCKKSIKQGKIPSCNEYIHNFLIPDLPDHLKTEDMRLNRCESHLLKLIIPFIRIAHVPRSNQFKVKGPMITVEADVDLTMSKIIPRDQDIIPIIFKRTMKYKGHVMEEIISKRKVIAHFEYLKSNNPLFREVNLSQQILDDFMNKQSEEMAEIEHTVLK